MSYGGMQSSPITTLTCKCGRPTSKILRFSNGKEISIHFTKNGTYWHIFENNKLKRVLKKPIEWE